MSIIGNGMGRKKIKKKPFTIGIGCVVKKVTVRNQVRRIFTIMWMKFHEFPAGDRCILEFTNYQHPYRRLFYRIDHLSVVEHLRGIYDSPEWKLINRFQIRLWYDDNRLMYEDVGYTQHQINTIEGKNTLEHSELE
jgi:hypothetical protein